MKRIIYFVFSLLVAAPSVMAQPLPKGKCQSADQSWFELNNNRIELFDSLFGQVFTGPFQLVSNSKRQHKLELNGSTYYFTRDNYKPRLFYVYETSSATSRSFYCPIVSAKEGWLAQTEGVWLAEDQSVLEINIDGTANIEDLITGEMIEGVLEIRKTTEKSVKFELKSYYIHYDFLQSNKIWVYSQGKNRLFRRM
ncbi:MAG: hypothetical protein CMP10_05180 [Zetaproteobacteria bacterium]|nr:hypothetical protein [Pseudobdellovibrionaceae bacterium]